MATLDPERDLNTPSRVYRCGDDNDDGSGGGGVCLPGNTDNQVYSERISKQMFPFSCFPYNQARDASAQIFGSFQVDMAELVDTFRAPERILRPISREKRKGDSRHSTDHDLARGVAEVLA
jgi:hypothetical protein